jgi:ribosomal protein S18 acetylase RimI-like enzyme
VSAEPLSAEPSFRLATESDAATLLPFMREYYSFDGHGFDEQKARVALVTLLRDPNLGRAWLILDREEDRDALPVGYIVLCFGYSLEWLGRDAFVDEFFLLPDYRGRGWGRKAMAFLEDSARKLNVTALHLEVMRDNTRAMDLYRKLGFEGHQSSFLSKWIAQHFSKPVGRSNH